MSEETVGGRQRPMGRWLLAAIGGAVAATIALVLYYRFAGLTPVVIPGTRLQLVNGEGGQTAGGLEIRASGQGWALARGPARMTQAALYRRVVWQTDALPASAELRLVWATLSDPRTLHERPLPRVGPTGGAIDLTGELRWQGRIAVIGLAVRGPLAQPITLRRLELWPTTLNAGVLLHELVADWTTFDDWTQRSINFIEGAPTNALFPPVVTVALWILFSALLYGMFSPLRVGGYGLVPYGAFLLLGWLALDVRWQADLSQRLEHTEASFAGKTQEERGVELDGDYGQFLRAVRQHLPDRPVRLLIINAETPSYRGGRARYLLLPHNGYAGLSRLPPPKRVRAGDYLLVLTPPAGLDYDPEKGILLQQDGYRLPAERLYTETFGALYRMTKGG